MIEGQQFGIDGAPQMVLNGTSTTLRARSPHSRLPCRFYYKSRPDYSKSSITGKPEVVTEIIFSAVLGSGEPLTRKATEDDFIKYAEEYERFIRMETPPEEGTPLEVWAYLTEEERLILKAVECKTVEQLAEVTPQILKEIGLPRPTLCEQAKVFLSADVSKEALSAENKMLRERVQSLEKDIQMLRELNPDDKESSASASMVKASPKKVKFKKIGDYKK